MKHTRFPKGTSGNPKGRPKKILTEESTQDIYNRLMEKEIALSENGHERQITLKEAVARKTIALASEGNGRAISFVFPFLKQADRAKIIYLILTKEGLALGSDLNDVEKELKRVNLSRKQKGEPILDFDTVIHEHEAYPAAAPISSAPDSL